MLMAIFFVSFSPDALAAGETVGISEDTISTDNSMHVSPVPVPEPSEKTLRYYQSGNQLWVVKTLWGLLVPALILFTGFSARLRNWAKTIGHRWFFIVGVYLLLYLAVVYLLNFPISYFEGFVRQHEYGLSNQSFQQWIGDSLKALMVAMVVGVLFLWVPYLLLKRSPRRWWLYTSFAAVPFLALTMLVAPVLIAPLFDDFGPMQDKALEAEILALADRAGIAGGRVFEVNKSEDTEAVNAYVGGLLDTKRIVLWDTLLAKLEREQVLTVMAHEMGHYVLGHMWQLLALFCVLVLVALYAVHRSAGYLIRRYQHRFGFTALSDVASLPLLVLLISLVMLVTQPIALAYSRYIEREADRFALEITRNNPAMASAFNFLQDENLAHPDPGLLYVLWRSHHPTIAQRVRFSNDYKPWQTGEPLKYAEFFRRIEP
jgi:Zn-dependent protease with chaperone function